eukprot:scaffold161490_cov33-Prasinocladus_malaysianus.AAC.10
MAPQVYVTALDNADANSLTTLSISHFWVDIDGTTLDLGAEVAVYVTDNNSSEGGSLTLSTPTPTPETTIFNSTAPASAEPYDISFSMEQLYLSAETESGSYVLSVESEVFPVTIRVIVPAEAPVVLHVEDTGSMGKVVDVELISANGEAPPMPQNDPH